MMEGQATPRGFDSDREYIAADDREQDLRSRILAMRRRERRHWTEDELRVDILELSC